MCHSEKLAYQSIKHKEDMERQELERAANMLEKCEKKRKAVEKFERMKATQQKEARTRNTEKSQIS